MSQLITVDRATLEQLVGALEKSVGAMQGLYGGWRCEQPLKLANSAITAGHAALANAEPKKAEKVKKREPTIDLGKYAGTYGGYITKATP